MGCGCSKTSQCSDSINAQTISVAPVDPTTKLVDNRNLGERPRHKKKRKHSERNRGSSDRSRGKKKVVKSSTDERVVSTMKQMFEMADLNDDGRLSQDEFVRIVSTANLNLDQEEIWQLMVDADENEDGFISLDEWLKISKVILQQVVETPEEQMKVGLPKDLRGHAPALLFILTGWSREKLCEILTGIFALADVNRDGVLNRKEFRTVLQKHLLPAHYLSTSEVHMLMQQVDGDGNAEISYEEFYPFIIDLMAGSICQRLLDMQKNYSKRWLEKQFIQIDNKASGSIALGVYYDLCQEKLNLTESLSAGLLSNVEEDDYGFVKYMNFISSVNNYLQNFYSTERLVGMCKSFTELQQSDELATTVHGLTAEQFRNALLTMLRAQDPENLQSVPLHTFYSCLRFGDKASGLSLSDKEIRLLRALTLKRPGKPTKKRSPLISGSDQSSLMLVPYMDAVEFGFDAILWLDTMQVLARETALRISQKNQKEARSRHRASIDVSRMRKSSETPSLSPSSSERSPMPPRGSMRASRRSLMVDRSSLGV
eukprot:Rmarinus@m.13027